jgi:hypothetical protein
MDFKSLIDHLSFDLGSPLVLDESGRCKMNYQNRLEFFIGEHEDNSLFYLYAIVCPLPKVKKKGFYKMLLEKHMLAYKTAGATFGVATLIDSIILFRNFETAVFDYYEVLVSLEQFVRALDFWMQRLPEVLEKLPVDDVAEQIEYEPQSNILDNDWRYQNLKI